MVVPPEFVVVNSTAPTNVPFDTTISLTLLTWAVGFTVILKSMELPWFELSPFVKVGVTVIFATIDSSELFVTRKSKFPEPSSARPISELSLLHV